jgi:hypothetical protein
MFFALSVTTMLLQAAAPAPAPAAGSQDEMVCRRIEVTGSLARKERVCKTRLEWRRISDSSNSRARAIVEYSASRPPDMQ